MLQNLYNNFIFGSASSALENAKGQITSQVRPIANDVVVPLADLALVILLIVAITKSVSAYREGEGVRFAWPLLLVIGIVVVSSFPTWGWAILG